MADRARPDRAPPLSPVGEDVRRHDRDRFTTALFAPPDRREALFALYAFNAEVASIREKVQETMIGFMRLQWWRDTLDGVQDGGAPPPGHPVAQALAEAIRAHALPRAPFEAILEAREVDMGDEPPADRAAFLAYARGTGGAVQGLAARVLAGENEAAIAAAECVGTAWSIVGLLRAAAFHAAQTRVYLPRADLRQHGIDTPEVLAGVPHDDVAAVARALGQEARECLKHARAARGSVPRAAVPALLPAVLAEGYLKRLHRVGWNVFHPDLAVVDPRPVRLTLAALLGRW